MNREHFPQPLYQIDSSSFLSLGLSCASTTIRIILPVAQAKVSGFRLSIRSLMDNWKKIYTQKRNIQQEGALAYRDIIISTENRRIFITLHQIVFNQFSTQWRCWEQWLFSCCVYTELTLWMLDSVSEIILLLLNNYVKTIIQSHPYQYHEKVKWREDHSWFHSYFTPVVEEGCT